MIIGLDVGAGLTKGVLLKDSSIIKSFFTSTDEPTRSAVKTIRSLLEDTRYKDSVDAIAISGGGSRKIGEKLLGISVIRVDEIQAIGVGGLTLAG